MAVEKDDNPYVFSDGDLRIEDTQMGTHFDKVRKQYAGF